MLIAVKWSSIHLLVRLNCHRLCSSRSFSPLSSNNPLSSPFNCLVERNKGIFFVAIDQTRPLSDQGLLGIILHKRLLKF